MRGFAHRSNVIKTLPSQRSKIQRMSTYKVLHSEKEIDMLKGAKRDMFNARALNKSSAFGREASVHGTFALIKGKVPILYGVEVFNKSGVREAGTAASYEKGRKVRMCEERREYHGVMPLLTS